MRRHGSHSTVKALIGGQQVEVKKNFYDGLWYILYMDVAATMWAGAYKTKREAVAKLMESCDRSPA